MQKLDKVSCLKSEHTLKDAVLGMTQFSVGAACIVDDDNVLIGIVTDGDVRRLLSKKEVVLDLPLSECMTKSPLSVNPDVLLREALRLMEDRPSEISIMPVVEKTSRKLLGMIRVHDVHQTNFS
jgi:arabinose-5-phosphate isomerase